MIRHCLFLLAISVAQAADVTPLTQTYAGGYTDRQAPPIVAPGLTTTLQDTCMGSTSAGLSLLGFGVAGGSTWKDEECIRRLNARELATTLHDMEAAKELMCGNPEIHAVYQSVGRPCLMQPSDTLIRVGGALPTDRTPRMGKEIMVNGTGDDYEEEAVIPGKIRAVAAHDLDHWKD